MVCGALNGFVGDPELLLLFIFEFELPLNEFELLFDGGCELLFGCELNELALLFG